MTYGDLLIQILPSLIVGAGVYAGVRADLARLHEIATFARNSAEKAHDRINSILEK